MSDQQSKAKYCADISKTTRLFFYLCAGFFLSFVLWASFAELDIVSEALGEVIPSTKVKRIQHLEGGIVRKIEVKEGAHVKAGQPLVTLESTATDSNFEELRLRVDSLRMEIARLETEAGWIKYAPSNATASNATGKVVSNAAANGTISGAQDGVFEPNMKGPVFPADIVKKNGSLAEQARKLYFTRLYRMRDEISTQWEKIKQRQEDINTVIVRIRNNRHRLSLLRKKIKISEELLKDKLTTQYEHLNLKDREAALISSIEEDKAQLKRSKSVLAAARVNLASIMNTHREEVATSLRKARQDYQEFIQRLRKMRDNLRRTIIRSPVAGVVKSVNLVNVGEIVRPGVTIMDIVPADDKLVIEAHMPLGDIGYLQVGQEAIIKLASNDARRYGNLKGVVKHISPDALSLPDQGTFYKVMIETESDYFESDGRKYQLYPGMRVIVGILTGQRTVMEYLLYPYFDALYEGMRER